MHQTKIPSLCTSGTYKWTSLSECHHTKCATERTPQVPISEGTITGEHPTTSTFPAFDFINTLMLLQNE